MNLALASRPRLIQPGLPRFEPGVERYRIAGGGAVVLALFAGDRLEITDLEGRQRAELAVFASAGQEDAAALGLRAEGSALGINRLLAGSDAAAKAVAASLRARGLPRAIAKAVDLFQHDSLPGETIGAVAARSSMPPALRWVSRANCRRRIWSHWCGAPIRCRRRCRRCPNPWRSRSSSGISTGPPVRPMR